jgi:hypothetical protein
MAADDEIDPIPQAVALIESLAPGGCPVPIRTPLLGDECVWFRRAVADGVIRFSTCGTDCFRFKKWGVAGPDHFATPHGKPRHLFSKPIGPEAWLNREYVPHIAAYAYAVLEGGYSPAHSSFSFYRTFTRDLIAKRAGGNYETDAEFYDRHGSVHLQVEAKASQTQTETLAGAIERHGALTELPRSAAKEVEYVLDLAPKYLWVVGPGSVDPAAHVYAVAVTGRTNATFTRQVGLPPPPVPTT